MTLQSRTQIIGLIVAVFLGVLLAWGYTLYIDRVNTARQSQAFSEAMQLRLAAIQYAQDHKGRYPDAGKWEQELMPYMGSEARHILHPPAPFQGTPRRFSLNPAVSGKSVDQVSDPSNTWLFYESVSLKPSASDNLTNWPNPDKDGGNLSAVVYCDGHAYLQGQHWKSTCQKPTVSFCGGGMGG